MINILTALYHLLSLGVPIGKKLHSLAKEYMPLLKVSNV